LVHHVFVAVALVFDDDRAVFLVQPQRTAMRFAGGVLAGEAARADVEGMILSGGAATEPSA